MVQVELLVEIETKRLVRPGNFTQRVEECARRLCIPSWIYTSLKSPGSSAGGNQPCDLVKRLRPVLSRRTRAISPARSRIQWATAINCAASRPGPVVACWQASACSSAILASGSGGVGYENQTDSDHLPPFAIDTVRTRQLSAVVVQHDGDGRAWIGVKSMAQSAQTAAVALIRL